MKILICVSGLPYAKPTLRVGDLVAGLRPSQVSLLTVVEQAADEPAASEMLNKAKKFVTAPVAEVMVRWGKSVPAIIQAACQEARPCYDLIVVGSRHAGGLFHLFSRSLSQRLTDRAPVSVLVVKEERPSLQNILVCVGGQQMNPAVIEWGAKLAQAAGANVQLLYVADPVPQMYTGLGEMDETVPELLQSNTPIANHLRWGADFMAEQDIVVDTKVRQGIATDEILLEIETWQSDLLVIGARAEMNLLNELLMDKVTPHLVEHAPCSVLVVR